MAEAKPQATVLASVAISVPGCAWVGDPPLGLSLSLSIKKNCSHRGKVGLFVPKKDCSTTLLRCKLQIHEPYHMLQIQEAPDLKD